MSDISRLDFDCLLNVFSHFSHVELVRFSNVCQAWYEIASTNFLWKGLSTNIYIPTDFEERYQSEYMRLFKFKVNQDKRWIQTKYSKKNAMAHEHSVRGVAFSPVHPNLLASSGYDSTARLYNVTAFPDSSKTFMPARRHDDMDRWERLSRVKWTCDGFQLTVASSSAVDNSLHLYDVEQSIQPLKTFPHVSSQRLDRTALAPHPKFPFLLAVAGYDKDNREGGDISLVDTRVPDGPVRIMRKIHQHTVRDIEWIKDDELLTASPDGTAKVSTLEGRTHTSVTINQRNEHAAYEGALSATRLDNTIAIGCGGCVEIWDIYSSSTPVLLESVNIFNENLPVWRVKYNQRGTLLFVADDEGFVKLYHREKVGDIYCHRKIANVLSHDADVSDLDSTIDYIDISLTEDYVASASQSREVGLASVIPLGEVEEKNGELEEEEEQEEEEQLEEEENVIGENDGESDENGMLFF